jgi:hypothetical protein
VSSSIAAYSPPSTTSPSARNYPTHGASAAAYCREKAYVERLLDRFELAEPGCARLPRSGRRSSSNGRPRPSSAGFSRDRSCRGGWCGPSLIPALPVPRGLRLQACTATDVADAISACIESDSAGAFNLAADDILGATELAELFDARPIAVSPGIVRGILASTWAARIVPAPPDLFDALMRLPVMSTCPGPTRARVVASHSASGAGRRVPRGTSHGRRRCNAAVARGCGPTERLHDLAGGVGQ